MTRATGRRFLAAVCFLLGGLTVIGIPLLWPIGYVLYRDAKSAEQDAAERDAALQALAEQGEGEP